MAPTPNDRPTADLLRILALKRHEVPPPGFFDRLPNRILVNIRAGSTVSEPPWWIRLWDSMVREPMVASSYAALAMGGLLFGFSVYQTAVQSDAAEPLVALHPQGLPDAGFIPPTFASLPKDSAQAEPGSVAVVTIAVPLDAPWPLQPIESRPGPVRYIQTRLDGIPTVPGTLLGHLNR